MEKLRLKMIKVVVLSVIAVFAVVLACIFGFSYHRTMSDADTITDMITKNGGRMLRPGDIEFDQRSDRGILGTLFIDEESQYTTRFFIVYLDDNAQEFEAAMDNIASVSREEAMEMSFDVLSKNRDTGFCGEYRYRVCRSYDGQYIVFLNCSSELNQVYTITTVMGILSIVMIVLISVVFTLASKKAIRPFEENARRQKQFITDAGHELKTPLAIISANADVLDYKSPDTKEWTSKIKNEVKNLNHLIAQLLFLSKSEEVDANISLEEVDFSKVVNETVAQYRDVLASKNVKIDVVGVASNLVSYANFEGIERLVSILFDNCAKYVKDDGDVIVGLKKSGRNIVFSLSNTDSNTEKIDCQRLFDRFYRSDSSRNSKTGGHGIGLSIAKRICEQHKGSISAQQKDGMVTFCASIPNNLRPDNQKKSQ